MQIAISVIGLVAIIPIFYYGNLRSFIPSATLSSTRFAFLGTFFYFTLGGYWVLIGLGAFAGVAVTGLASYFAYGALNSASKQFPSNTFAPPPPSTSGAQFCPNCGHAVDQSNNYCPACGTKIR